MEEIKAPKKERKFLKAMGEVALTLVRELLLNAGKKLINKSGNKRQSLVLAFVILASTFAIAQYPATGNKQRLGYQTSGDGLVFRGRDSDTTALKPSTINNAYHLFDTLNNVLFSYIKTKGGWKFNNSDTVIIQGVTMPFDSITFNTAKDGTVGVAEVEYNDTQGSLIQGLKGGLVTNVIGQQLHQRVNNRTGATLTKGTAVYLSGSQGNRITVAKALGVTDAFSANTFGIVAESIANNQSGYVITEGLITNINTSSLVEDSAVYLSPTVAGGLTSTKPQAPQHAVYIGVCVKSNAGSGEVFVKIRNGQELDELHDVRITSPVDKASLYYKLSEKLWRDTTAALLTSDTASLSNRINLKLNIADTASMLAPYFKDADTTSLNLTSRFAAKENTITAGTTGQYFRGDKTFQTLDKTAVGLSNVDNTSDANKSISTATQTALNLKQNTLSNASTTVNGILTAANFNIFNDKQPALNGMGFVKASGTNITYDNSSYLRTGLADSSYLKLTGGTLTGGLTGTSATFSSNVAINTTTAYKPVEAWANANDFVSVGVRTLSKGQYSGIHFGYVELNTDYRKSAIVFQRRDYTGETDASGSIHLLNVTQGQGGRSANLSDAKITISNNGNVGINDTTPSTTLDVNGISAFGSNTGTRLNIGGQSIGFNRRINDGSIYSSGFAYQFQHTTSLVNTSDFLALQVYNPSGTLISPNSLLINGLGNVGIGVTTPAYKLDVNGTLGVTGATTLSDLIGTGTRMVTASNTGLLSTQAIPTGTVTSVGGTGTVNGISLTGTVTSSGNLTLGGTLSGVSLSSQVTGTLPIANGGTGATTAATARTALGATVRGANTFILPDLGSISFLRYNADNTVSQRGADGMRTDLGGTTIGQSMFTLTNPSAVTFPRFNADNTVSALDAATFRTAIGAGTGSGNGTVTSVSINPTNPNGLTVATGTTTPVISMALAASGTTGVVSSGTQQFSGAKTFLGDINGSSALNVTGLSALNGGATIGTMATTSSLTHVIGVNSSNAIGEIGVADGIKFTSGFLGLDSYKTIALMDFPNTSAQSSSDITSPVTGAVAGTPVLLGVPNAAVLANTSYSAWVSSTNTVTVRFNNYSSSAANPAQGSFYLIVLNL